MKDKIRFADQMLSSLKKSGGKLSVLADLPGFNFLVNGGDHFPMIWGESVICFRPYEGILTSPVSGHMGAY